MVGPTDTAGSCDVFPAADEDAEERDELASINNVAKSSNLFPVHDRPIVHDRHSRRESSSSNIRDDRHSHGKQIRIFKKRFDVFIRLLKTIN